MIPDIRVVNKHQPREAGAEYVYIGRGSPLGNPFSHLPKSKATYGVRSREEAVAAYEPYLDERIAARHPETVKELNRIFKLLEMGKAVRLECFCKPKACHGDVVEARLLQAWAKKYGAA